MKKILVLILALVMTMSLTACGGGIEEIEITHDNWKDYLEIKKNVNIFTDAFDEIESVSLLNCLYLTSDSSISNSLKIDGNDVKIIVKDYETIHVVRIQGTIKVYK